MEIQILGGFELVDEWPKRSGPIRSFRARPAGAGPDAPITHFLKVWTPGRGDDAAMRKAQFDHETALLARLNHTAIPSYHAHGTQAGVAFVAMDYMEGVPLAEILFGEGPGTGPLSRPETVFVAAQIADALEHLHALEGDGADGPEGPLDALHCDVNPNNILLTHDGYAMLVDFSAAQSRLLPEAYRTPTAGTLGYMAPERLRAPARVEVRSDLFSLAVTIWEMLQGRRCFPGDDPGTVLDGILALDLRRTSHRIPGLSGHLSEVLRKNLEQLPDRRYRSAQLVVRRLSQTPEARQAEAARRSIAGRVQERLARRAVHG